LRASSPGPTSPPARAGIGPLAPLDGLHDSYLRAGWALRATTLAPNDHPVVAHWSETGVDGMLAAAPVERFTVDDLPAPVRRLLQDRNTRRWVPTLEVLLASAGDIQQAASDLELHRSTVYYRLERLSEVAGTDLRRGDVLRELHVGLRVARLAGLL
jgi:sugar diacid utilization regulator